MTIKEIEYRAGLPRASVRYYESEGLIHPTRAANGYRDYSGDDLNTLLKIKLLRELGCSLEEILALQRGTAPLDEVLQRRLEALEGDTAELERAKGLCRRLREAGVTYESLEPGRYLAEEPPAQPWSPPPEAPKRYPWRRLFARTLDFVLYGALARLFFAFALNISTWRNNLSDRAAVAMVSMVLMVAVEPLFLHFFRTTPGKWICRLRLGRDDGTPFTYGHAALRTALVVLFGCGLQVPVAGFVTRVWSFFRAVHGDLQPWETDEEQYEDMTPPHKDFSWLRVVLLGVALYALAVVCYMGGELWVGRLPYSDPQTVEEFVENYNKSMNYATRDHFTAILLRDGTNFKSHGRDNPYGDYPDFTYELVDGWLKAVAMDMDVVAEGTVTYPGTPLACAVNALEGTNAILLPYTSTHDRCKAVEEGEMDKLAALPDGGWHVSLDYGAVNGEKNPLSDHFLQNGDGPQRVTIKFRAERVEKGG